MSNVKNGDSTLAAMVKFSPCVEVVVGVAAVDEHSGVFGAHVQKGHLVPVTTHPEGHPMAQTVLQATVDVTQLGVGVGVGVGVLVHRDVYGAHEQNGQRVPVRTYPGVGHASGQAMLQEMVEA
jgi:hypothetical protein